MECPSQCQILHHEVELGVLIGKPGRDITEANAMSHVGGAEGFFFCLNDELNLKYIT